MLFKGLGKGVIAANLIHPFDTCIGLELIENLYFLSLNTLVQYNLLMKESINRNEEFKMLFPLHNNKEDNDHLIRFTNCNFLKENWENASVIFTNSTCFSDHLMKDIYDKSKEELKRGAFMINLTKKMPSKYKKYWEPIKPFNRVMSWGHAKVLIYRKIK